MLYRCIPSLLLRKTRKEKSAASGVRNCDQLLCRRGSLFPSAGQNEGKKGTKVIVEKDCRAALAGMHLVKLLYDFFSAICKLQVDTGELTTVASLRS